MRRPRTLGRYIASRFLLGIVVTFLLCSVLIFLIDFVELLRQSGKYGEVPLLTLAFIALLRLPAYAEYLISFAVLVGSIATLLQLSRRSELVVMRAGGMSVWQFLRPGIFVALVVGALTAMVFNPLAAAGRTAAESLFAEAFGKEANVLSSHSGTSWLRQDGADGQSVISAALASNRGLRSPASPPSRSARTDTSWSGSTGPGRTCVMASGRSAMPGSSASAASLKSSKPIFCPHTLHQNV